MHLLDFQVQLCSGTFNIPRPIVDISHAKFSHVFNCQSDINNYDSKLFYQSEFKIECIC